MNNLWYTQLHKSPFTPPDLVFSIVWPILYSFITASFFIFYANNGMTQNKLGLFYFVFQLVLNVSWPYVFFTLKNIFYSFVIIILLFVFILLTIMQIKKTNSFASFLLLPYLLWVSFAAYLNWYIYKYSNN